MSMNLNKSLLGKISLRTYIKSRYPNDHWWMIPDSEEKRNIKNQDHFEAWLEWLSARLNDKTLCDWNHLTPDEWYKKLIV